MAHFMLCEWSTFWSQTPLEPPQKWRKHKDSLATLFQPVAELKNWKLRNGRFIFDTFLRIEWIVIVKLGMRQQDLSLNPTS